MTPITRLPGGVGPRGNIYASVNAWSADNTCALVLASGLPSILDHFQLLDGTGNIARELPFGASQVLGWSRDDPTKLYFIEDNALMVHVLGANFDGATTTIHTFTEYLSISGMGEKCVAGTLNGDLIALCGDDKFVFTFSPSLYDKSPVSIQFSGLDSLYITPDGNVLVADTNGIHLYTNQMVFQRTLVPNSGHHDVMRDVDDREVMIWTDNNDNAIYKVPTDGSARTKLLDLPWVDAVNIACPDRGFAIVSTYSLNLQSPGVVLKVPLDGSNSEILCLHESVMIQKAGQPAGEMEYVPQPKTCVSWDGTRILGTSNFGNVTDPNWSDIWMMELTPPVPVDPDIPIDYSSYAGKDVFIIKGQAKCATCGSTVKGIYERQL